MEETVRIFREMVTSGRRFSEIVKALQSSETFELTPFNLLRIAHEALGVPLTESRELFEAFGENMTRLSELRKSTGLARPYLDRTDQAPNDDGYNQPQILSRVPGNSLKLRDPRLVLIYANQLT